MSDFFKHIRNIKYEGAKSNNPLSFKFYNPQESIRGKTMREHLKFAVSYWHTICGTGSDMFGEGTSNKSFCANVNNPLDIAQARAYAAFEIMEKLDIDYFCFHDRDIAPEGATLTETNTNLDIITNLIEQLMETSGKQVLWGTANLFSNKRYAHGAATAPNSDVFAFAAAQTKKAIEITHRLGGLGYVFWGGREGYDSLLNTNTAFETENMARFLHMAADYAREIGFGGQFYIEPKPKEPTKHQYDYDCAAVYAFLQKYGLTDIFKLNIEANHATLSGHSFQHELRYARENNLFGSIDANMGDLLLGWDIDQFPTNVYDAAMCMYEVIKAGGFVTGGLNFDAKVRRGSFEPEDIFMGYISGMDTFALGLKLACRIIDNGRIDTFVSDRYQSYNNGIGADILAGKVGFKELEAHALNLENITTNTSSKQEYLESIINQLMFGRGF
ncbi:MAG: xylose isomerase [Defluviitaleaceae bacterium]|nr:xylose isomerase [Defluviitaleaceae bacterium]